MSLRWRIALALAALGAVVAALAAAGSYMTTARELRITLDDSLSAQVREVGVGPGRGGPSADDDADCPPVAVLQPAVAAQVVRPDGSIAVCLTGGHLLPVPAPLPVAGEVQLVTVQVGGGSYRVAATPFHDGGTIQLARDAAGIEDVLAVLRLRLAGLTLVVSLCSGLVGWLVARRLMRPVVRLRDAARTIERSQDLSTPVVIEGSGELRDLAQSFTAMVEALANSREQQRRLMDDASHEMRTPLTSLTTNLELLEHYDDLPADERPDVLGAVRTDVEELTHLMTELVELATDRSSDEPLVLIDLADLAAAVTARAVRRSERVVTVVCEGEGLVLGRAQMIERAIANLVDNALKYSPAPTPIEVHVAATSVEVRDHGPGIDEAERVLVFDRFYRSGTARTAPGSGLGLAIVRQVADRHGGRVWARSGPNGGARVGFELPTAE